MRITPDMKKQAKPETVEALREVARSIRCVVVGDMIACNRRQQLILEKWWREHRDD
jgi:hypothetical protein